MAKQIPVIREEAVKWAIGVMIGAAVAEVAILLYIIICQPMPSATLVAWAISPVVCITTVMVFVLRGAFQGHREKEMESAGTPLEAVLKALININKQ